MEMDLEIWPVTYEMLKIMSFYFKFFSHLGRTLEAFFKP